uniref:Glutaredoxin domain-containing protein n=1 Tax=viral metagenome TaxID=1070528 RepID=A0A6C0C9C9_9ZZZZ
MDYPIIIKKILDADSDTFVMFYVTECPYCQRALKLLRDSNVKYKGYIIDKIPGGMPELLKTLTTYKDIVQFNDMHHTKPIIFYNNRFLGGADDLSRYLGV